MIEKFFPYTAGYPNLAGNDRFSSRLPVFLASSWLFTGSFFCLYFIAGFRQFTTGLMPFFIGLPPVSHLAAGILLFFVGLLPVSRLAESAVILSSPG